VGGAKSPQIGGVVCPNFEESTENGNENLFFPAPSNSNLSCLFIEEKFVNVSTMNGILLWLLSSTLPNRFVSSLIKKPEIRKSQFSGTPPQQFIQQLVN
jgi:hypothetical protein